MALTVRRKTPVVDAVRWDGNADTANRFIGERYGTDWWYCRDPEGDPAWIRIASQQGRQEASVGWWIIKDEIGWFWAMPPEQFAEEFEPA